MLTDENKQNKGEVTSELLLEPLWLWTSSDNNRILKDPQGKTGDNYSRFFRFGLPFFLLKMCAEWIMEQRWIFIILPQYINSLKILKYCGARAPPLLRGLVLQSQSCMIVIIFLCSLIFFPLVVVVVIVVVPLLFYYDTNILQQESYASSLLDASFL